MKDLAGTSNRYFLVKRYITRRGGTWNSSIVPVETYDTFAGANQTMLGINLKKLAKEHSRRKGDTLTEIRLEIYIQSEKGEKRIRVRNLSLKA